MINLKIDPEFQSQIPPLTDDEFKQLEENILKEGKLISPLIVWNNTLVDGHNRYAILQKHPEIYFSTIPLPFESREEVLAWICKNQLGRRNLTPEQKKFLIGKQYSVEHRKPGGNGNNQHTAAAKKTAPEELCQIDTIPPTSAEASIRKQIAERNNVSESYVVRSEKFMRGVEIMEQMMPGMQEKILSGQFKVRDADMHRLARADFPNRKQIVHEILHPEDRPAPQKRIYGINYSALEAAVRRIQQDVDFLMKYLPKVPDDAYVKVETTKILKQHKAYMAQFEESLKQLKAHGAALTNIEVTEANIGAFKPCAKKYGVDFTLRKDKTTQPPHYIVIFKAKDADNLEQAFREFTAKTLSKEQRPSIRKVLAAAKQKAARQPKRAKEKIKQRGLER